MGPLVLLINASKVVGLAGLLGVAANVLAYRRFRRKNLTPFENPVDELQDVLAVFPIDKDVDDGGFFFAVATAPAHVEDKLDDAWLEFAKDTPPKVNDRKAESKSTEEPSVEDEGSDKSTQKGEGYGIDKLEETLTGSDRGLQTRRGEVTGQIVSSEGDSSIQDTGDGSSSSMIAERGERSTPPMDEWEVISQGHEKEKASNEKSEGSGLVTGESEKDGDAERVSRTLSETAETPVDQSQIPRGKGTTEEPLLQFNLPKRGKKMAKVAMEAMLRGYEKIVEEDDKPNVAAWHNVANPEQRVRFWSDPDTEIKLAQGTNVKVFRMGIDWKRIMPSEPVNGIEQAVDWAALDRYNYIIERVLAHGMRVMLTLFHHSLPQWAATYGGWREEKTVDYFLEFTRISIERFARLVDFWITFNEPHVFAMLTYCAGAWPGGHPDLLETATCILPEGIFNKAMNMMAKAHLKAYDIIHNFCNNIHRRAKVGVAHHVSFMRPYGLFDVSAVVLSDKMTRFACIDDICHKLDFVGINYYGQEVVSAPGLKLVENDEFSESGRGVYPDGLYRVLIDFHNRYKKHNLPYIITENGVSDATDYIRRPYLVEHLLALRAAMDKGIPVHGYCFWTTSDNWEWADGYGPKFGLAAVDREHNLKRIPRPSYYLFSEVVKTGKVTKEQRTKAWDELQIAAVQGKKRPFCRAVDSNGLMYAGGLDIPIERPFVHRDWRFGHYCYDGLQDPLSRLFRFLFRVPFKRGHSAVTSKKVSEFTYEESIPDSTPSLTQERGRSQTEEGARELVAA